MSEQGRLALVLGVLLGVPLLVILVVSLSGDPTTMRRPPNDTSFAAPSPAPSASPSPSDAAPRSSPAPVSLDPTELPALDDDCEDDTLLDEEARRAAFQDGLAAERDGTPPSEDTERWLRQLGDDLERCAASLTSDHTRLRGAMERTVAAAQDYRGALTSPRENSVNRAWSELDGAIEEVVRRWDDVTQ